MAAPIFVLSCERSGSTLLRFILDTHPQVAAPGEVCLGQLLSQLLLLLARTVGQVEGEPAPVDAWWLRSPMPEGPGVERVLAEARGLVEGVLERYARGCGKLRWACKSPDDLPFAELLHRLWPEARFLCLYRNSLDVASSCLHDGRYGFMQSLTSYVAANPANTWAAMLTSWADKTEQLLHYESRFGAHRVRYEDLVRQPEATLQALWEPLGLPDAPGLLEQVFRQEHHAGGGDPRIWETREIEVRPSFLRWPVAVPPRLHQRVNELHLRLGYSRIVVV